MSAWEPQPLEEQSRGVPSATEGASELVICVLYRKEQAMLPRKMVKLTGETGHGDAISTLDGHQRAVSRDGSSQGGDEE